jgi:hypothetical protein
MKTNQTSIYQQHTEHTDWTAKLQFYKDEIKIMQNRLDEVVAKNNGKELMVLVEYFQNQLIIKRNNLDELLHEVKQDDKKLENIINKNAVATDHKKLDDHKEEREDVAAFEKYFNELRKEFNVFLAKSL